MSKLKELMDEAVLECIDAEIAMLNTAKGDILKNKLTPKDQDKAQGAPISKGCTLNGVMKHGFKVGQLVSKKGGDYRFDGYVVAAFTKISGEVRYVVEDDRGILHIYSDKNLVAGA